MVRKQHKVVLPPALPPEVPDEEIELSDEDVNFVQENKEYAGFVSKLDTHSITKHVTRVADADEAVLEAIYEKRLRRKLENKVQANTELEVDPVDALPVKTLDGQLYYRRVAKKQNEVEEESTVKDSSIVKLSKSEKRAKLKKSRKEAKKLPKEIELKTPQAEVLDQVRKDLKAEETVEKKKYRLAELGTALLADPESNIKNVKEMLDMSKGGDISIVMLALKSLLAVFKDIIPGYRIRLPTEKEMEMKVSKAVKKMRFYESTLLSTYKEYVKRLVALHQKCLYKRVAVRCLCTLLAAVPHFNFSETLLAYVVNNIGSQDDFIRENCCSSIKSLFTNEGKHGGEATVEAVKLIAELVKTNNCQLHRDSVEVFLSLSFEEDLVKPGISDLNDPRKNKKFKKRKGSDDTNPTPDNAKKLKKEMISKTRMEVNTDFKTASLAQDPMERKMMQSQILSSVFETFFRILKHATQPIDEAGAEPGSSEKHPLLVPCLDGIGKFSHLIDMDFMADLMHCLRKLAGNGLNPGESLENSGASLRLSVSERLRCCIVAFKVMRSNLNALNIDLQEFYVHFYNLILDYRPGRDQGEVLAEALKIMLCDDRQHDMQRAAAFIKRLSSFSLCFGSAEAMAALVTVKHLLQKNVKCRSLLENDVGGGSVAGTVARYQAKATDPNQSGALASVLWELNLLIKHYHPSVSSVASAISTMNTTATSTSVVHHVSPQQAYSEILQENDSSPPPRALVDNKRAKKSRKEKDEPVVRTCSDDSIDEEVVKEKVSEFFGLVCEVEEGKRLRFELERKRKMLKFYEEYNKERKEKKVKKKKALR